MATPFNVHELLEKEVSRQEFLRLVGLGVLSLIGVMNIINHLQVSNAPTAQKHASGYGYSPYGR